MLIVEFRRFVIEQQHVIRYECEVVCELIVLHKNTRIRCKSFRVVSIGEDTFFPDCSADVLGVVHHRNRGCLVAEIGVESAASDGEFPFEMLPCDVRS